MRRSAERGQAPGGPRPYGYQRVPVAKPKPGERTRFRLVPHEPEATVVRRIFSEFCAGKSQQQIARDLNLDGIGAHRGGEWFQCMVSVMLCNPTYAGRVHINGESFPGELRRHR